MSPFFLWLGKETYSWNVLVPFISHSFNKNESLSILSESMRSPHCMIIITVSDNNIRSFIRNRSNYLFIQAPRDKHPDFLNA